MRKLTLVPLLSLCGTGFAQLALPNPAWLPPNSTYGTRPSDSSSVNPQWSTVLGSSLYFYEEQRSGKLPSTKRVAWRNDSALDDGKDVGLDLTGGYYDAGDYVKFTFPMSFAIMSICWGALDFGKGYDLAEQTPYLDDMLRWSLDWLIKAHPSPNTLYVQVGDVDLDNDYWGGDLGIPTPRPSFPINETSPGTDAAAQASAAFAACSALYANHTLSGSSPLKLANISYASTLLTHAQQLYSFATNSSIQQRTYQTSVPSVADAYASSGYADDLAIAALFLALASNSSDAYSQAGIFYQDNGLVSHLRGDTVFNWDEKTPGVAILGAQIAKSYPNLASDPKVNWQRDAEEYLDRIVNGSGRGFLTRGGLLWYDGDSDNASLNPAMNAAMLLTRFADSGLASTTAKRNAYYDFARKQVDYLFGNNPMTVPYVVGVHPNSPSNPHSAMSTGAAPEDTANIDTVPEHEAYVLYGGVIGGPNLRDNFWDIRSDWVQNEVALDYTAPLLTLAARALVNDTSDPFYVQLEVGSYENRRPSGRPCDNAIKDGCGQPGWKKGRIAMAVIVTIVGLAVVGLGAYWLILIFRGRTGKT